MWIDHPSNPLVFKSFFRALNNWGTLQWTCNGHLDALIFLDLRISIDTQQKLFFQSYQKPMNLYLYIPPISAHPAKMLDSLIYGRLRAYRIQNTDTKDFVCMSTLLAKCLCNGGYSLRTLLSIFQTATNHLTGTNTRSLLSLPPKEAQMAFQNHPKSINPPKQISSEGNHGW
jgi:hypothetical protein